MSLFPRLGEESKNGRMGRERQNTKDMEEKREGLLPLVAGLWFFQLKSTQKPATWASGFISLIPIMSTHHVSGTG